MVQKLLFLAVFLFCFPHFCSAFDDEEEDLGLPFIATVKKYIPKQYDIRQGDIAFESAQVPQNKSENPAIYRHTVLLSLGNQCIETSKTIVTCNPEETAFVRYLPDRYTPIMADVSHLTLYDSLTKMTSSFPRIEIKVDLLLLALSYAEASDRCLPREIMLRIARSVRLKETILVAFADSYETAALTHGMRPFKFPPELRETLAPYCHYQKTLYEGLVNKESSYIGFLEDLRFLKENAIILRPTPSCHTSFENLPLNSLFEESIALSDCWAQRSRAVSESLKIFAPPSLAKRRAVDENFERSVQSELERLSQQVSILQDINTQLKECVTLYQTKLGSLTSKSNILSVELTANVIENVRAFIEQHHSFFAEIYRERIMRLYSLVGTLKAIKSPLDIPNLQDIMLKGPHFDPRTFIEVGKKLRQIRDGFRLFAYDLQKEQEGDKPLPAASKSKSSFSIRKKPSSSQSRLESNSTPSISISSTLITIVDSSMCSSKVHDRAIAPHEKDSIPSTSSNSS